MLISHWCRGAVRGGVDITISFLSDLVLGCLQNMCNNHRISGMCVLIFVCYVCVLIFVLCACVLIFVCVNIFLCVC